MRTAISAGVILALSLCAWPARSQVTPDGSLGTEVEQQGHTFEIRGGELSGDGANLFHSFDRFDLTDEQTAQFMTPPEAQNVLGRVTGGGASTIDGLIQVIGSNADLFLMNPAGIVFGENAQLNVAGDFTATTASGIEFESGWFEAIDSANWSDLTGEPIAFDFSGDTAGAIASFGNLAVNGDANLNLFGGTVIAGGTLSGGNVSVTAIEGGQTLQLSAVGNVLGLEVASDRIAGSGISPIALPELLSGGELMSASSLEVVDGVVRLSGAAIEPGDSVALGAIDASGETGGTVQVLGDRVLLSGANIDATGELGGGAVYLGGDYRGLGTLPTAEFTVVDGASVVDASAIGSGDGGEVIVWADDTAGFFGQILARGGAFSGDGGFVETSGAGSLVFRGGVDVSAPLGAIGSVLLDPTNITISSDLSSPNDPSSPPAIESQSTNPFKILEADYDGQDITINAAFLEAIAGNVTLEATNDITLATNLTFVPGSGAIVFKANSDGLNGGAITGSSNITAPGRNITLRGHGISVGDLNTSVTADGATAGTIILNSTDTMTIGSTIRSLTVSSSGVGGEAGAVTLYSEGDLQMGGVDLTSGNGGTSGALTITGRGALEAVSSFGEIFAGSGTGGTAGTISIDMDGDVTYTNIQGGREMEIISDGSIALDLIAASGADVTLTTNANAASPNTISIRDGINTSTTGDDTTSGDVNITSAGDIQLPNGGITTSTSGAQSISGAVTLSAVGAIDVQGISTYSWGDAARSGDITVSQSSRLNVGGGGITTPSDGVNAIAGDVTLNSTGAISFYEILSYGFGDNGRSGDVTIDGGSLNIQNIQAQSSQTAGNITIDTTGNLTILDLLLAPSSGADGTGGNVNLTSGGNVQLHRVLTTAIGNAGDVRIEAGGTLTFVSPEGFNFDGSVTPGFINALSVEGTAGDVVLEAEGVGTEALSVGQIDAFSYNGAGGSGVTVNATGDASIGAVQTGASQGTTSGNITIVSTDGNLTLTNARATINNLRSVADIVREFPSNPSLDAIKTTLQALSSDEQSGLASSAPASNVTLSALNGSITATGDLDTYSESGAAGQVSITSDTGLTLQNVTSYGNTASGNLTITSTGTIATADITTLASSGQSGNVIINGTSVASGNVSSIAGTGSGNITITATDGTVSTRNLRTTTSSGSSGSVTVGGTGSVTTGNVTSSTGGSGSSGNVTTTSTTGSITSGNVSSTSAGGNSGNISLDAAEDVNVGNITTSAGGSSGNINLDAGRDINTGNITSAAINGDSGDIDLNAGRDINAGDITTSTVNGDSGDIGLTAGRDINAGDITSSSVNGQSGDISLDAGRNINVGDVTTEDGQIALNADGTINTGELNSENAVLINGEVADDGADGTDTSAIAVAVEPSVFFAEQQAATIAAQQRETAIATVQTDSSLNPNTVLATTTDTTAVAASGTSDAAIVSETQADLSDLARLSSGFLTLHTTDISLDRITEFDDSRTSDYTQHFGGDGNLSGSVAATREAMAKIEEQTGVRTGVVYVALRDTAIDISVITAEGAPVTVSVPVDRDTLLDTVATYRDHLINARFRMMGRQNDYAATLYNWLIRPIAADLEEREIDTLMLSLDVGLRGLPIAALYDGEQYLIENYSLSLIPSMGLIDTRYQPLTDSARMLAMGASEFTELSPLPAVPAELEVLANHRRSGDIVLNDAFTRRNILAKRDRTPYPIVHLATHAEFNEGSLSNSYIQLWDERLGLDQIRELGWHDPAVELLVLSACRTALGNNEAEMGFAGLAVAAGVKTAIASLWYVDDSATFMLMTELYNHLATAPIKAEALRAAQLALMSGDVRIEDGQLYAGDTERIALPESLAGLEGQDFSHPYYWSAFTAIGAPW